MKTKLVWTSDPEEARGLRETGSPATGPTSSRRNRRSASRSTGKRRAGKTGHGRRRFEQMPGPSAGGPPGSSRKEVRTGRNGERRRDRDPGDHVARVAGELEGWDTGIKRWKAERWNAER